LVLLIGRLASVRILRQFGEGEVFSATRIAAPVGQARTQARPPSIPGFCHLITCDLGALDYCGRFRTCWLASYLGTRPNIIRDIIGFFRRLASIEITPYGQLRWQLPQPIRYRR
jgi:hypothetical protein